MVLNHQGLPTELSQDSRPILFRFWHIGAGITMNVMKISNSAISPATGVIYKSGCIQTLSKSSNCFRLELAPTFIKGYPGYNRRMIVELLDHITHLIFEIYR